MIRSWLNKNSTTVSAAAVLLMIVAVVWMVARIGSGPPVQMTPMAYFYDLNEGELFEAAAYLEAPIQAPSGPHPETGEPMGVRAHVFSCGDCRTSERFIGYLEKPGGPPQTGGSDGESPVPLESELYYLVRRPDDREWVRDDGPEAERIRAQVNARCGQEKTANYCRPKMSKGE